MRSTPGRNAHARSLQIKQRKDKQMKKKTKKKVIKKHWYFSKSCQRMEKASDKDIKAGKIKRCMSAAELKKELCE